MLNSRLAYDFSITDIEKNSFKAIQKWKFEKFQKIRKKFEKKFYFVNLIGFSRAF